MEPERHIEKLLRAYAKKRSAQAGDAFKLHPVTRRQLHDAVAKQFAEEPEAEESVSLWQLFRQQWAFLLMFVFVLFFGASLLLPALSKAKMKSQKAVAMSQLKQIGAAVELAAADNNGKLPATLDALTNGLVSRETLTDPVSGQPFVYVAGGKVFDELSSNSVLAYSPADKKGRAVLLADGSVRAMTAGQFEQLNRHGLVQPVAPLEFAARRRAIAEPGELADNRPVPTTAPVIAGETLAASGSVSGAARGGAAGKINYGLGVTGAAAGKPAAPGTAPASNGYNLALAQDGRLFKADDQAAAFQFNLDTNAQRFVQTAVGSAQTPPVLAAFEIRQDGNAIAVVDRDGSVYRGFFEPESPAAQTLMPPAEVLSVAKTKDSDAAKNESAAEPAVFFRVTGENRSLKQNVVFAGSVVPLTNTQPSQTENKAKAGGEQPAAPALFLNSRITGTATVAGTNSIEINAVPAQP